MTRPSALPSPAAGRSAPPAAFAAWLAAACVGVAGAAPLAAQATTAPPDVRWQAWYGCWTPSADAPDAPGAPGAPAVGTVTCVSPDGGSAVQITTVAGGRVTGRDRLVADGVARPVERDGCRGTERAAWSADGRRVYLHSESACAYDVRRSGDGVLAFAASGEWLDVRSASVGGYTGVRGVRYAPAAPPSALPADVAAALAEGASTAGTARLAAAAPIGTGEVVEATRAAGPAVTGAWLAELRQRFPLDARRLVALADAGVPGSVTDVMIATSNPQVFAVGPSGAERSATTAAARPGREIPVTLALPRGGWGWGWDGFGYPGLAYDAYRLGYGALPYGALGYGAVGLPGGYYPGGWWGRGPVVVVRPGPAPQTSGIVRGRGYTQGDAPTYGTARGSGASANGSGGARSAAGSGSSSSGGGSSSRSSGSGSLGTAKPRP